MKAFGTRVRALLFPPRCASCGILLDWYEAGRVSEALCDRCRKKWDEETLETCEICGEIVVNCRCITEELSRAKVAELCKLVYYRAGNSDAVQNRVIFRVKKRRDQRTVDWLCAQMQKHLDEILAKVGAENVVLTYAPRAKRAVNESGTDQAEALARALSHRTGVPLVKTLRRNAGRVQEQKLLSAEERIRQAKKNYSVRSRAAEAVKGKTVVLVDDIVTTGATAGASSRLLRRTGALEVHCLVVATDDTNRDAAVNPTSKK